jgi:hypothetical protein
MPALVRIIGITERGERVFDNGLTDRHERVFGILTERGHRVFYHPSPPPPPPEVVTTVHRGWAYPIIKRPRVVIPRPRRQHESVLFNLRLRGSAINRTIARETAGAALRMRSWSTAEYRANDGDLLELFITGVLSFDDLIIMGASEAALFAALLFD